MSRESPRQIIGQALQGANAETLARVGNTTSMARTIQRCQRKSLPKEPTSIADLLIPDDLKNTG